MTTWRRGATGRAFSSILVAGSRLRGFSGATTRGFAPLLCPSMRCRLGRRRRPRRIEEDMMADRGTKERKLVALMVNDLGPEAESEVAKMEEEARSLSDEELDETLAGRLDLPFPIDAEVLDRALAHVEEPGRLSEIEPGGFTGAPDMSHEPRPEERKY